MTRKVSIIGAGGVGSAIAFAALVKGVALDVALYDLDDAKAEAEASDLRHGLRFAGAAVVAGGSDPSLMQGSDVVVVTAGAKQRVGETRLDLAARNSDIVRSLVPAIRDRAPDATILIVSNPVDVLTHVAWEASGLDRSRVFGSGTVLDSSRLQIHLAEHCQVDVRNVHASIVGEHGDSEFPLWSSASIGNIALREWGAGTERALLRHDLDRIATEVKNAAYHIIEGKGATTWAIGLATTEILSAIFDDARRILPVSSVFDGEYGLSNVALSMPSIVDRSGVAEILDVPLDSDESAALRLSADTIAEAIAAARTQ